jgi:hypothetical protein
LSGIRVCMVLLIALCMLQTISLARPSVLEIDQGKDDLKAMSDLDELEALLTGQHPGSSFAGDAEVYRSSRPGPNLTPLMDLPYMAAFFNDTVFGSFIKEWATPMINQSYEKDILNSPIWNSTSGEGEAGISHRRKPVLVSEPDF